MQLNTSYKQILAISTPIMLGSAVQNVIAATDVVFLARLSKADLAAIGIVGVFYLIIAAVGFGFSKGGQIMIARRMGEGQVGEVGRIFYAMVYFELLLAVFMFMFMQYGSLQFFSHFVDNPEILFKCIEYLEYRSYGVFFSYAGVGIVALYTGVARTNFIVVDTLILAVVNFILNWGLIFGKWGLPEMGIAGAGLASTIAEIVAFVLFVIYIFFDKKAVEYNLFKLPKIDFELIKQQQKIATPIVAQAVVGMGSWFFFFGLVENLGERESAITSMMRIVYLVLSIPCWGFASGINTMVSNLIGQNRRAEVLPLIWKTALLCLIVTVSISLPVILFPQYSLYPFFGEINLDLIQDAQYTLYVLFGILMMFAVGGVYFNGLAGTGATFYGLMIQTVCAVAYVSYVSFAVKQLEVGLEWAWAAEIFYWMAILGMSYWYLKSNKWHKLEV
jgi:MATE family multidrug resistance protein